VLSLSLQRKLKKLLSLEKLETLLLPHTRMALTVMMAIGTLLLPTRAALSLTLAIVVVAKNCLKAHVQLRQRCCVVAEELASRGCRRRCTSELLLSKVRELKREI
jgi:hypothetical protein